LQKKEGKIISNIQINDACSLTLVLNNHQFCSDYNATLKEVRKDGITVTSQYHVPEEKIDHAEVITIGGKGQPLPFAGEVVNVREKEKEVEYQFRFKESYYAKKFLSIHSPKSGAGRKRLCKKPE